MNTEAQAPTNQAPANQAPRQIGDAEGTDEQRRVLAELNADMPEGGVPVTGFSLDETMIIHGKAKIVKLTEDGMVVENGEMPEGYADAIAEAKTVSDEKKAAAVKAAKQIEDAKVSA